MELKLDLSLVRKEKESPRTTTLGKKKVPKQNKRSAVPKDMINSLDAIMAPWTSKRLRNVNIVKEFQRLQPPMGEKPNEGLDFCYSTQLPNPKLGIILCEMKIF